NVSPKVTTVALGAIFFSRPPFGANISHETRTFSARPGHIYFPASAPIFTRQRQNLAGSY
ncbi:MAG: hypothetical protein U9N87_10000, partial [Planctomycetota bacterium]|nr:hypothetical protein [Planctomycetota bacterium]